MGPFVAGTLSERLRKAFEEIREHGHEPSRLVVSSECLRHLRDEGAVAPHQGDLFGVPVGVDFSWEGDAFAITSRDSLTEIVTEANPGATSR